MRCSAAGAGVADHKAARVRENVTASHYLWPMISSFDSRFSRRAFVAAPFILAAGHALAQSADVDVVIIGAGAAGLAAAHKARGRGLTFQVVEARGRIGGRTVTDIRFGAPIDGGATFIHFADKNPWTQIASDLGIETRFGSWRGGGFRAYSDGVPVPEDEELARRQGRNRMWELAESVDFDHDVSFARLVERAPAPVRQAAHATSRGAVGEEPERVSVADYSRLYDGSNLIVPAGYGTLVARYGADIPVSLETTVSSIDWSGQGVTVQTNKGTIRAKTAILTVPLGVLKAEKIRITPAMPREMLTALDGLKMGALSKVLLRFEGNRFGAAESMHLIETGERVPGMTFEMWPFGSDVVVGWYGADYARQINAMPEEEAIRHMLDRLVKIVGEDARKAFRGGARYGWSSDPFALGSYSYAVPGQARARDVLRQPVAERLWLAGEAMAGRASMTVAGAHQTGDQAAEAIATRLLGRR